MEPGKHETAAPVKKKARMEQGNDTSGRACWIYHRTGGSCPDVLLH